MSAPLESDDGKTASRGDVFRGSRAERPRRARVFFFPRAAIVLGAGAALFAAGVFIGRSGAPEPRSGAAPQLVGFDAASIQLLDASLELTPIDGFDAGDASSR